MGWSRPEQPTIPTVYYTFRAKDAYSDQLVTYRVEDLTEDRYNDMIQHFTENFVDDEPLCENRKVSSSVEGIRHLKLFWHWCFAQNMTLVCHKEGSGVKTPEKYDWQLKMQSQKEGDILAANEYLTDNFDLFGHYGVDKYLAAFGLSVNRRYRGRGIATDILKARVQLCKAFGIKLTTTTHSENNLKSWQNSGANLGEILPDSWRKPPDERQKCVRHFRPGNFTAPGSQRAAAKAGFKTDLEVT
ncbi:conserved hypothetical protein [Culex quinquefasciatus]|uniref:N-acetyltransferase domain-containing protein n=1 Tax=Culex quinquefasciatus TaxID=7176 RepID=B0W0U4_CULQU|nr:conserved hypothetical protein [Culex quinquefasciatus]|eukprot:XP_001842328.1 conserved hypothetical protein [Culex quinquefasciatus]